MSNIFQKYADGGYGHLILGQEPGVKIPRRISCVYPTALSLTGYAVQWTNVKDWPNRHLNPNEYPLYTKHDSGICLKTGEIIFVDIDIDEKELAREIAKLAWDVLGPGMARGRDNSSRLGICYMNSSSAPVNNLKLPFSRFYDETGKGHQQQVEVLGTGNQFVVEGKHNSGGRYIVHNFTPKDDLPVVTSSHMEEFVSKTTDLIPSHYEIEPHPTHGKSSSSGNKHIHDLFENFEIMSEHGPTTVGDILADPNSWHKVYCCDPYEPGYDSNNRRIAVIYTDSNRPLISSFAHGGTTYHLHDHSIANNLLKTKKIV